MGGVHKETLGQGRGHHDFDYLPFSEKTVVLRLIQNRMKLDTSYGAKMFPGTVLNTDGGMEFVENIANTYITLDMLIADAALTKPQHSVVNLSMLGWTVPDIAEKYGVAQQTIRTH